MIQFKWTFEYQRSESMIDKLKKCEMRFLMDYPMGFDDKSLKDINKRHNFSKMATLTQERIH